MEKTENKKLLAFRSETDLKATLATQYMKQIENFFGDPKLALEFLSNVVASVQRVPKLMECTPDSLLNSFVTMASLKLMPSGVSGEAFVLPYENKKRGVVEAQFQLGYQGLVTLLYRAGVRSIVAEIVRKNDPFKYENGVVHHNPDPFSDNRGEAIGAYVIVELQAGGKITKVMSKKEILAIGEKFSMSFRSDFSPWKSNDPELWMWKKTALKQAAKLVPKNETIYRAIAEDNRDAVLPREAEAPIEVPVFDAAQVKQYEAWLRDCKTKEDFERVWADIPADYKPKVKGVMEEVRAMILAETAPIQ
jgi:recombination protein RecT